MPKQTSSQSASEASADQKGGGKAASDAKKTPADKTLRRSRPISTERTSHGLKAVGVFSDRVSRPILGRHGLAEGDLLRNWETIVGTALARLSQPEGVRFRKGRRDGGELTIRAGNGAAATMLQHEAGLVLERINRFYGYAALDRMKIVQAPLPDRRQARAPKVRPLTVQEEQSLHEMVQGVTDPELRESLESLGRSMLARRRHP